VTIIAGPNASGKTNLLEAILVSALGSSYRGSDSELISFHETWARLDAIMDNETRTLKLVTEPRPLKTLQVGNTIHKRLGLKERLPVVLFEPNHLQLLSGSPEARRNYLDELLSQLETSYATTLRRYKRVLAQRNRLLKQGHSVAGPQLFPWNIRLSELGAVIARRRADLAVRISERLPGLYQELAEASTIVTLEYQPRYHLETYESNLLQRLEHDLELDIMRGFTAAGPHREDFQIFFDNRPSSETASRGETRTAVLCLKIIELEIMTKLRSQTPLLLLDDVFSELDQSRRQALTTYLQPYQTFLTTTDADVVTPHFAADTALITISR
jgi:DNA replication and repair protein RecF